MAPTRPGKRMTVSGGRKRAPGARPRSWARTWHALLIASAAVFGLWALQRALERGLAAGWLPTPKGETCRVARVLDGDSLRVLCAEGPVEVRLHCIDAPERGQVPWSRQSRRNLRVLAGGQVEVREVELDRFGRRVAEVYGTAPNRPLLNLEQVRSGNAAVYRRYCSDSRYERAERQAREAGLGIWSRPGGHQTPWTYRHRTSR
jgi:endonuclease YncB( thermonuclease family)